MPGKRPQLAKLTRPRLYKAVARERLFALLDEKRQHPVVWIAGPPGAGKTTLVATYLEAAEVPAIWYQVDAGDSDAATFFFYLKLAIEHLTGPTDSLPLLTNEFQAEPAAFARLYFRQAFTLLPERCVLVFDNVQEVAADSILNAALAAALTEIPLDANVIAVSRSDPPQEFSSLVMNRTIAMLSWEHLRLEQNETALLAQSRGVTDPEIMKRLYRISSGWIAGMAFMLDRLDEGGSIGTTDLPGEMETLFGYFANLFFDDAPEPMRVVLMKTALLPRISASVTEGLTGDAQAIRYLEDLHKRHLFTDRRAGTETTYQFHALFRAFLLARAEKFYMRSERNELEGRAAALMEMAGYREDAFTLYVNVARWDDAARLLLDSAPRLIQQGRWLTLSEHFALLPRDRIDTSPWLRYWLGRARTFVDLLGARPLLESAWQSFEGSHDTLGQLLCAATILEGYFVERNDLRPMDVWTDRVDALLQMGVRPPSKVDELRVLSSVMGSVSQRSPGHPRLGDWAYRVMVLLEEPLDANVKLAAAGMLQSYSNLAMDPQAERTASEVARSLLELPQVSTYLAIMYWYEEGYTLYIQGRYEHSLACFDRGDALVGEANFLDPNMGMRPHVRGLCERRAGLLERAEATLRKIEAKPIPKKSHFFGGYKLLKASICFDRGRLDDAISHIRESFRAFDEIGHFNGTFLVGTVAANMAIAAKQFDFAEEFFDRLDRERHGIAAENTLPAIYLNRAWLAHRRGEGDEATKPHLERALCGARDQRARGRFRWYCNALAELLPIALAHGMETEVATKLIREFDVVPAAVDVPGWPWPIEIRCLGEFELLIDGVRPSYSRKMPQKVLGLLKTIIAFGIKSVPERKLMDALWPDEDGDAARRSLTATLHRLRKLLGNPKVIRQSGAALTLDTSVVWIDVRAFETALARSNEAKELMDEALNIYRGGFLSQDDVPWTVPTRERLRAKFVEATARRAADREASGDCERAAELYLRGIDTDPLVEDFYQGLMRCYDRLNRRSEAASVFRRLRQTLSVTLGVQPSAASQRLFESLRID